MSCTIIEHDVLVYVIPDDCNAEPVTVVQSDTTVVVEQPPAEVIHINAGARGLPGPKGDKGDKGDDGDVAEAPLDGSTYARQSGSWVQALAASARGAAGGVASLDANGKLPESQIPAVAISDVYTVSDQPGMLALDAQRGDIAVRADVNKSFVLQTEPASVLANWLELRTPTDAVLSVAGKTGAVALVLADIDGLAAALAGKQDTMVSGSNLKTVGGQSLLGAGNVPVGDVLYGTPDPAAGGGADGDVYIQVDGRLWKKAAGSWSYTGIRFTPQGVIEVKTSAFTAADGGTYACDTTTAGFTVTPPASPVIGTRFRVLDRGRTFNTKNLTVNTAAQKVLGAAETYIIDQKDASRAFIYIDSTIGWMVTQ